MSAPTLQNDAKFFKVRHLLAIVWGACVLVSCGGGEDERETAENTSDRKSPAKATTAVPAVGLSVAPGLDKSSNDAPLADLMNKSDPGADASWSSEAFSSAAGKQLKKIADALAEPRVGKSKMVTSDEAPKGVASPDFPLTTLYPVSKEIYRDGALSIRRTKYPRTGPVKPQGFVGAFSRLRGFLHQRGTDSVARAKFKIVRVEMDEKGADTEIYFEAFSQSEERSIQITSTWKCRWARPESGTVPLLASVELSAFEEAEREGSPDSDFVDATAAVFKGVDSFGKQLVYGADHWYGNRDVSFGIHQGNQGIAVGDADGDGLDDLFVCQPAGLPSLLYLRKKDGTLSDVTTAAGLDWLDATRSALFADLDNDGDQDLAVSIGYSLALFKNSGPAKFELIATVEMHSWPSSIAAADYDNDGDCDIYVTGYNPRGETAPGDVFANPVPYHDANNGARNFMLQNEGSGLLFKDVTEACGLNQNNRRFSFAASWEDYDNDGDQDIYVANDFGRNNLFRNDLQADGTRKFTDVAAAAGVEDIAAGMSVSWGDYNRDGRMDLYVSNMFSSAGNRVAYQRQFKDGADADAVKNIQRHARGNTLFENVGDGTFRDVSVESGVTMGRWSWGSTFADLNNDGWEDVVVANGFFSTPDTGDL